MNRTTHSVSWHGEPGHPNIKRYSWLPSEVTSSATFAIQQGFNGVNVLLDNPGANIRRLMTAYLWGTLTSLELSVMIDHSFVDHRLNQSVTPEAEIISWFGKPELLKLFEVPTYLRDGRTGDTRPRVLVFTDPAKPMADLTAVQAALPNVFFLRQGTHFSWPSTSDPVGSIVAQAALPTLEFSGVWDQFNDSDPLHPGNSVWGGPARICPPFDQNGLVSAQMRAAIPPGCRELFITLDDYQEGTGIKKL